ncbi:MAG: twitching motility protein PilT [Cenarchaeum symbiont of Oopsacas minuta]|nr:twitching motility protein PilT [Cenarchaeum symbiont of Oopsacas minuta]
MPDILCDTSFMMHMACYQIKNIDALDTEIGPVRFLVPDVVLRELVGLSMDSNKSLAASAALERAKKMPEIKIGKQRADSALVKYISKHGGVVATLDKKLKSEIKKYGGSIMSVHNDRIVIES